MFKDPVCKMMVDEKTAKHVSEVGGKSTCALQHASHSLMQILGNSDIEESESDPRIHKDTNLDGSITEPSFCILCIVMMHGRHETGLCLFLL
jgi:hypothetical protein